MNQDNEPLDELFSEAKNAQDQIAHTVELGVEARLQGQLNSTTQEDSKLLIGALFRLCTAGSLVAAILAFWVMLPMSESEELTSAIIEEWVFGTQ